MPTPVFYIEANGSDVTDRFRAGGLVTMTITETDGEKADSAEIVVDDPEGSVATPQRGSKLNLKGGYLDGVIRDYGEFEVDQVMLEGYPQTIVISLQAVSAKSSAKERRPKDYRREEYPTYGDIFEDVAGRVGLSLHISGEIASVPNEYEAQSEETEQGFLTRLGAKLDAAVMIKNGRLVVVPKGEGESAGGSPMPKITIRPGDGGNLITYSVTWMDRPEHDRVVATWYDRRGNTRREVEESTGMEGPAFLIREAFQSEDEAKQAAEAKAKQLKRGRATASFTIDGDPMATAGAFVEAEDIRDDVDGTWSSKTVTHEYSSSEAFSNIIECELPNSSD